MRDFLLCAIVAARLFAQTAGVELQDVSAADLAPQACDTFATEICRVDVGAGVDATALVSR
jgi:hypothetical protein